MAYITPETDIRILRGIPWTRDGKSTMWWENESQQSGYMINHTKYVLSGYTYQRVSDGVCRINEPADGLYECNYMMFKNTAYGNKWFYAFITDIDYVNDACSNVHYEIDSLQTWFFEAFGEDGKSNIKPCYVLRQHAETDEPGDNTEPEPVELSEYLRTPELEAPVKQATGDTRSLADLCIIVAICDVDDTYTDAKMYNSIFSGSELRCYDIGDESLIESLINSYIKKPESILQIYMCPKFMVNSSSHRVDEASAYGSTYQLDLSAIAFDENDTFSGYVPKNKKLYTYPYYYGYIISNGGQSIIFRYEFTKSGEPEAFVSGSYVYPPQYVVRPYNYGKNEKEGLSSRTFTQAIMVNDFPQCSWNNDTYKQWQGSAATELSSAIIMGAGAVAMVAGTVLTGGALAAVVGVAAAAGLGEAVSQVKGSYTASNSADVCKGQLAAGAADTQTGLNNIFAAKAMITAECARDIDDYFTMYGYAQNRVFTPNPTARRYWTYMHTDGFVCGGNVPTPDKEMINSMFNSGFTAWNYHNVSSDDKYGDYSLDNKINT